MTWAERIARAERAWRLWAGLPVLARLDRVMKEAGFRDLVKENSELRVCCDQQERNGRELFEALKDVLDSAERMRRGDTSLDPEEWHARRDFARHILSLVEAEGE